jgi:hypothetical protein
VIHLKIGMKVFLAFNNLNLKCAMLCRIMGIEITPHVDVLVNVVPTFYIWNNAESEELRVLILQLYVAARERFM